MESQSILSYIQLFVVAILFLAGLNLYLLFRLREIDPFKKWNPNQINGVLCLLFMVVGLVAAFWSTMSYSDMFGMVQDAASVHGKEIDNLLAVTMFVVLFVFVVVNAVLFYFAYRYRGGEGVKALYYPHNNKIELIWTIVPAIVLSGLVFYGVGVWHDIMAEPPADSLKIELYGKQFDWTIRYAGVDNKFGESNFTLIDDNIGNTCGMNLEDAKCQDDFYITDTIVLPVKKPVYFRIIARDVLHSATMMQFRMKMDAVPGMPTSFWMVPDVTTAEMRARKHNPEFNYEMSCQQICGGGHWNMRRIVKVVEQAEYDKWFKVQKSFYAQWREQMAPPPAPATDSTVMPMQEAKPKVAEAKKAEQRVAMN